jgi:hypothetical protein
MRSAPPEPRSGEDEVNAEIGAFHGQTVPMQTFLFKVQFALQESGPDKAA